MPDAQSLNNPRLVHQPLEGLEMPGIDSAVDSELRGVEIVLAFPPVGRVLLMRSKTHIDRRGDCHRAMLKRRGPWHAN